MKYFENVADSIAFIETNLCEPLTVRSVAERTSLSVWHFQRIFCAYTGETIGSYVRKRRLACAANELKRTESKVIDLAFKYDFGSAEAFSRAFKKEFGIAPQLFRASTSAFLVFKKPELNVDRLRYTAQEIVHTPVIKTMEPILVAGLRISFASPLSQPLEYMKAVTDVWKKFVAIEPTIPKKISAIKVGVIENMSSCRHHLHDDLMDYCAGTLLSEQTDLPSGLTETVVPGGKYAVFRATGFHQQTQFMIDYVYSTWLPQSSYRRAEGPEFTWLDHRQIGLNSATSPVDYYFPIL